MEAAFRSAPVWEFGQAWRDGCEPGLRRGTVRLGWSGDRLCYFATLEDEFPVMRATERNQHLWEMGDVLELFAGVRDRPAYVEYHTAPNGHILQLLWPDSGALSGLKGIADLARFIVTDDQAVSRVRIVEGGWQVYGELPASLLPGAAAPLAGQTWLVSFGRYDTHADGTFTLSNTLPLTQPTYHCRQEWREIEFV